MTRSTSLASSSKLRLSVVTGTDGKLDLGREIRLVGPALLYADEVSLISPIAQILGDMRSVSTLSFHDRLRLIIMAMPDVNNFSDFNKKWREFMDAEAKANMTRAERRRQYSLEQQDQWRAARKQWDDFQRDLQRTWEQEVRPNVEAQYEASKAAELEPARRKGLLKIERVSVGDFWTTDSLVDDLFSRVSALLSSSSAYPLLDPVISNLVRLALEEKKIVVERTAEARAYEATAAATFMNALPSFPNATIAELLGIREELRAPLVNFRKALYEMREASTVSAFDADIQVHLQDVYARSVLPAIEDIKTAVQSNGFLRHVRTALREDVRAMISIPASAGLYWVNDALSAAQQDVLGSLVAAGTVAHVGSSAMSKRAETRSEIEQRAMYFLYQAEQRTSRLTP